jgi:hypothetical protein
VQQLSLRLSQVSEKELLRRGDKYEDACYYWEMVCATADLLRLCTHTPVLAQVIVARKVLLMSMFQLYDALFAVLLATGLVMISLGIHIFARPFEDAGTNWVEMLTLTSQLFLLVAGPVFKTLVRDRHTRRACRP